MKGVDGSLEYSKFTALAKCVMCISHGNSDPKRSFSLNKTPLNVHGALIREETIEAVWLVKKFIIRNGGLANIQVTGSMIRSSQNARQRYETYLVEREGKKKRKKKFRKR